MHRLTFIFLFFCCASLAQTLNVDSLKKALTNAKHDTTRVNTLLLWGEQLYLRHPDTAFILYKNAQSIAENNLKTLKSGSIESKTFIKGLSNSLNDIATVYNMQGEVSKSLDFHYKSLKLKESIGYKRGIAQSLNNLGAIYQAQGDIPKALEYLGKGLKILEEIGSKEGVSNSLNSIGIIYHNQGNMIMALESYKKCLVLLEEIDKKEGITYCLNNIGAVYYVQGDISKALEYYGKSLKVAESINDKYSIANCLGNIGRIYQTQGEVAKAIEYFERSLKIREEIGDKSGIANSLNNIAMIYKNLGDPFEKSSREKAIKDGIPKALEYLDKSLRIREEIGDKKGIASCLNNIGWIYKSLDEYSKAMEYYERSLKIREELGEKSGIANSINNIGVIYFKEKKYLKAEEYGKKSMLLSRQVGNPETIQNAAELLSNVYKCLGKYKPSLENYELFIRMRDSLKNEETKKGTIKNQLKYEYDKKATADSVGYAKEQQIAQVQMEKQKAEIRSKRNQQYFLFGGLGLVLVFALFMYNRFRITRKQKKIIEAQKITVEEKQKEILDSIYYARRIQRALITSEKYITRKLKEMN